MKIINITHSDLDGVICAILLKEFSRQKNYEYEVFKSRYENVDSVMEFNYKNDKNILFFITDISLKNESPFIDQVDNIVLIDHHGIANKSKIKKKLVKTEEGNSACQLVYNYLSKHITFDDKFKKLVELGHDYDTYTLNLASSKALNYLYYFYSFERFLDRFENGFNKFTKDELLFLRCKMNQINEHLTNLNYSAINDDVVFVLEEENINEIADFLYNKKGFKYVFIYSPKRKTLGMRSNRDAVIHCGEFLELFGGGGHRCSGGVLVENDEKIKEILSGFELVYNEYHPPF